MANVITFKTEKEGPLISKELSELDQSIYHVLKSKGPITRGQLAQMTGIARSTLYDALTRLSIKGRVIKYSDRGHTARGRPKVFFEAKA